MYMYTCIYKQSIGEVNTMIIVQCSSTNCKHLESFCYLNYLILMHTNQKLMNAPKHTKIHIQQHFVACSHLQFTLYH